MGVALSSKASLCSARERFSCHGLAASAARPPPVQAVTMSSLAGVAHLETFACRSPIDDVSRDAWCMDQLRSCSQPAGATPGVNAAATDARQKLCYTSLNIPDHL